MISTYIIPSIIAVTIFLVAFTFGYRHGKNYPYKHKKS